MGGIAGDEQAGTGQEFQQQVRTQLQVIEHKLDSLMCTLTSATELQPPRCERKHTLTDAPGVEGTGCGSLQQRLPPPPTVEGNLRPPPAEPLRNHSSTRPMMAIASTQSWLALMPSLFQNRRSSQT